MTRRHSGSDGEAFNSNPDTGRRGYRMEWEAPDDRPLVVYHEPFWADDTERMTYEAAAEADKPRDTDTLEGYLARLSAAVLGRYKGILPRMRRSGGTRVERERQLQKLRGQIGSKTEVL
jgi:hypothetical protein